MPVPPHDALDTMAWVVGSAGILLAITFARISYDASKDTILDVSKSKGFGLAFLALGLYLFINGLLIIAIWPFGAFAGGAYDVLYGGSSAIGGLLLLALGAAIFTNSGLRPISYFAGIAGIYAINGAIGILTYRLSKTPEIAALAFLAFAITAILTVPLTHTNNKAARWLFIIVAALFGILWLFLAATFTLGHLQQPV